MIFVFETRVRGRRNGVTGGKSMLAGRERTRGATRTHRRQAAAMDGVMNDARQLSNQQASPMVVPTDGAHGRSHDHIDIMVNANTRPADAPPRRAAIRPDDARLQSRVDFLLEAGHQQQVVVEPTANRMMTDIGRISSAIGRR